MDLSDSDIQSLQHRLAELRTEHRDLDSAISHMEEGLYPNHLQLRRLKRRRLLLKDTIRRIESALIPDLNA